VKTKESDLGLISEMQDTMRLSLPGTGLAMAFVMMLAGCKKDSNDEGRTNAIKFDNKEYILANGYLEYYGKVPGRSSYNMDVTLLSSDFTVHESNGLIDSVSGIGNVLYLEIFMNDSVIDSQTYTFDPGETREAGTFDRGAVGLNLNVMTYEGEFIAFTSGSFKLNKKDDKYEVILNCRNGNGKTISAYFKGTMKYYDYRDLYLKNTAGIPAFFKHTF
jgi:hypothetical protein